MKITKNKRGKKEGKGTTCVRKLFLASQRVLLAEQSLVRSPLGGVSAPKAAKVIAAGHRLRYVVLLLEQSSETGLRAERHQRRERASINKSNAEVPKVRSLLCVVPGELVTTPRFFGEGVGGELRREKEISMSFYCVAV